MVSFRYSSFLLFDEINKPENKPKAIPINKPILTFLINNPMAKPIKIAVTNPILLLVFILKEISF